MRIEPKVPTRAHCECGREGTIPYGVQPEGHTAYHCPNCITTVQARVATSAILDGKTVTFVQSLTCFFVDKGNGKGSYTSRQAFKTMSQAIFYYNGLNIARLSMLGVDGPKVLARKS
jgi:hypothetical protein